MSVFAETAEPRGRDQPPRVPPWRLPPADLLALLWREVPLMLGVFAAILACGLVLALLTPVRYTAHSSLLIRLGRSYVYQPQVGDAARGAAPDNDQVVQSELEILQSDAVKTRVVEDVGLSRLAPGRPGEAPPPEAASALEQGAVRSITSRLKVAAAPGVQIARLTFVDKDPHTAALVLNTLVDEYLRYRKTVLGDNLKPLDDQRRQVQDELSAAERAYQSFLSDNGIGDFETEKTSLAQIYSQLLTDRYSVTAQTAEVDGRLAATRREMAGAKPEIGLYRDLDHAALDKLGQLRVELQDLLSRYRPDAQPVREVQQKIAAEQALAASAASAGPGARRLGVNPVYQTLQTERNQLEAQAASLKDRDASVRRELAEITARRQRLTALEPQYQSLTRQRDLLAESLKSLAQREQESQTAAGLDKVGGDDSIRVVERAYPPATGASQRMILALATAVFALFAALAVGLWRAALHVGLPSRRAVERGLGLPVLAAVPPR